MFPVLFNYKIKYNKSLIFISSLVWTLFLSSNAFSHFLILFFFPVYYSLTEKSFWENAFFNLNFLCTIGFVMYICEYYIYLNFEFKMLSTFFSYIYFTRKYKNFSPLYLHCKPSISLFLAKAFFFTHKSSQCLFWF